MDGEMNPTLATARNPVAAIDRPDNFSLWLQDVWGDVFTRTLDAASALGDAQRALADPAIAQVAGAASEVGIVRRALAAVPRLRMATPAYTQPRSPTPRRPTSDFPPAAGRAGGDDPAGLPLRCVALTPETSSTPMPRRRTRSRRGCQLIAEAIAAFQADLEARGIADRVLVHVWSEFGRRAQENGRPGTDHGAAGVGMLIGTPRHRRDGRRVAGAHQPGRQRQPEGERRLPRRLRLAAGAVVRPRRRRGDPRRPPLRPLPAHHDDGPRADVAIVLARRGDAPAPGRGAGPSAAKLPTEGAPARLLVYAQEWSLWPSRPSVHAGRVIVQLWNRGQDAHDLRVRRLSRGVMVGRAQGGGGDPVGQAQPGHLAPVARDLRALLLDARPPQARHAHADHRPLTARAGRLRRRQR